MINNNNNSSKSNYSKEDGLDVNFGRSVVDNSHVNEVMNHEQNMINEVDADNSVINENNDIDDEITIDNVDDFDNDFFEMTDEELEVELEMAKIFRKIDLDCDMLFKN